jgi:hypothetical protein
MRSDLVAVLILTFEAMMDAIFQYLQPFQPYFLVHVRYQISNLASHLVHSCSPFELEGFGNLVLPIVAAEVQIFEVEPLRRSERDIDLIFEEGIGDVVGSVVVGHHHDDVANHLADLAVDETLPDDIEDVELLADCAHLEIKDVSMRLGIYGFQVFGVVVEIVSSYKQTATFIKFLQLFLLLLGS